MSKRYGAGSGFLLLALVAALAAPQAGAAPTYTVTDLGTLGGGFSYAYGINDARQVVGYSSQGSTYRGFLYDAAGMSSLGSLTSGGDSRAYGINNAGQVAGQSSATASPVHAVRLGTGGTLDIGALVGGGTGLSSAAAINDAGQMTGFMAVSGTSHAFVYGPGGVTDLGSLANGGTSVGRGINSVGKVVGQSSTSGGAMHAFLYGAGGMADLGTLSGSLGYSDAYDINSAGQVVGYSSAGSDEHAFLYGAGGMTDLGTLAGGGSSYAYGINDAGEAVGYSEPTSGTRHAFLYSDGALLDVNDLIDVTSGWEILEARDINRSGDIAAFGCRDGFCHAVLLTRQAADAGNGSLPEPSGVALAGVALAGLAVARRRRG